MPFDLPLCVTRSAGFRESERESERERDERERGERETTGSEPFELAAEQALLAGLPVTSVPKQRD